jgi:hypothetical protein
MTASIIWSNNVRMKNLGADYFLQKDEIIAGYANKVIKEILGLD